MKNENFIKAHIEVFNLSENDIIVTSDYELGIPLPDEDWDE